MMWEGGWLGQGHDQYKPCTLCRVSGLKRQTSWSKSNQLAILPPASSKILCSQAQACLYNKCIQEFQAKDSTYRNIFTVDYYTFPKSHGHVSHLLFSKLSRLLEEIQPEPELQSALNRVLDYYLTNATICNRSTLTKNNSPE